MKKLIFLALFASFCFVIPVRACTGSLSDIEITMGDDGMIGLDEQEGNKGDAKNKAWNEFFVKYKKFILGCSGFLTMTFILLFIICFAKLGKPGDVRSRKEAFISICFTGIGAALFGAATLVFGLFYNSFR